MKLFKDTRYKSANGGIHGYVRYLTNADNYGDGWNPDTENALRWFETGGLVSSLNFETALLIAEEVLDEVI